MKLIDSRADGFEFYWFLWQTQLDISRKNIDIDLGVAWQLALRVREI